jgi:hypothetical protein
MVVGFVPGDYAAANRIFEAVSAFGSGAPRAPRDFCTALLKKFDGQPGEAVGRQGGEQMKSY